MSHPLIPKVQEIVNGSEVVIFMKGRRDYLRQPDESDIIHLEAAAESNEVRECPPGIIRPRSPGPFFIFITSSLQLIQISLFQGLINRTEGDGDADLPDEITFEGVLVYYWRGTVGGEDVEARIVHRGGRGRERHRPRGHR